MDIEDALKAGHCVEFESGMQSCAKAICSADGRSMRSDADFMISHLVQTLPESCDPNESFPSAVSGDAGDSLPPFQRIVTWYRQYNETRALLLFLFNTTWMSILLGFGPRNR